jgi:hypothetical protein
MGKTTPGKTTPGKTTPGKTTPGMTTTTASMSIPGTITVMPMLQNPARQITLTTTTTAHPSTGRGGKAARAGPSSRREA